LASIAADADNDLQLRCEAVMAIAASDTQGPKLLLPLLSDSAPLVATTAARALTSYAQDETVRAALREAYESSSEEAPTPLSQQLRFALEPSHVDRPQTDQQWADAVSDGGDPWAGRRVFFGRRATCSTCHCIDGRGGRTGPDLSNVAAAKGDADLLSALLHPSESTSPDYQGYLVLLHDGHAYRGTQFHFRGEAAEMRLEDGAMLRFQLSDAEEYIALAESIMPERLEENLSVREVCDLTAFLKSLR
jgi:putative heme-binding domain-containing protein